MYNNSYKRRKDERICIERSVVMSLYFAYILVGLAIAMPVGAITVEMTKQG